jgi:hypothetical protein
LEQPKGSASNTPHWRDSIVHTIIFPVEGSAAAMITRELAGMIGGDGGGSYLNEVSVLFL